MLDAAFDSLNTYDYGVDPNVLRPIDEAIVASHGDAAALSALEDRLTAVLSASVSRDAKDYACRKLMVIGTTAAVPALADLLTDPELSHMARYALERIPVEEAAAALRAGLANLDGTLKVGVIGSLGVRQDEASIPALADLLTDADPLVACAAAFALGDIRSARAAAALADARVADDVQAAVTDASLSCAEGLLADGRKANALAIYKRFVRDGQPKHVRLAATRGMLACAGK